MRLALLFAGLLATGQPVVAAEVGEYLGAGSCGGGMCHGRTAKNEAGNLWLNESYIWRRYDRHSDAFDTLLTDESKLIAQKMGIGKPDTEAVCLDCHATNVPQELRVGRQFDISDGVGCESCHGPAGGWVTSHDDEGVTHAENVALGMFATEDPATRADICLECHMGDDSQFTTHLIMGAGHPQLNFEMATMTLIQAHYEVDDDYEARKGDINPFEIWLGGQIGSARAFVDLVDQRIQGDGMVPELALYDCQSCHHPLDDIRWDQRNTARAVGAGKLRLQEHHFIMLQATAEVLAPDAKANLKKLTDDLIRAGQTSAADTRRAAQALAAWLDNTASGWMSRDISPQQVRQVRKAVVTAGANGYCRDFSAAYQVALSLQSLSEYVGDLDAVSPIVQEMFGIVAKSSTFSPSKFRQAAQSALRSGKI